MHSSAHSCGSWYLPVLRQRSYVGDDFPRRSPNAQNRLWSADACSSWVSARSKEVVLGCASGSGSDSCVGHSVDCVSCDFVEEFNVVGHDCSRQMVLHSFQMLKNRLQFRVFVLCDDLEGAEKLRGEQFEVGFELFQRHEDSCGLVAAVTLRNCGVLEPFASKK